MSPDSFLIASFVPSARVALNTNPNPPQPIMFDWLKLSVAFSISATVRSCILLLLLGKSTTRLVSFGISGNTPDELNEIVSMSFSISPLRMTLLLVKNKYRSRIRVKMAEDITSVNIMVLFLFLFTLLGFLVLPD
ncbi:SKP1-like 8 [Striga asiatica]|uniref:SKP1-like 8 n=1 Tax=Striga asiatica TaxID=4170 RepID=A0A5A7R803_STRAF|nr:SKP1-like 8 [Striga asiatica]